MIIPTIEPFPSSPGHFRQVKNNQVIEDFTVLISPSTDVQEIIDKDDCSTGTGFRSGSSRVELSPCVSSGVECVYVVRVSSCIRFSTVNDDHVVSPQGGTMTAPFCGRGE